jgi:hypothetical protein
VTVDRRLESLRALKRLLDESFRLPGTNFRFGWDPIIGLIPWAGDAVAALLSIGIVLQAHQMRVPRVVQLRMLFNVAIDLLLGVVPFVGDATDFVWKASTKNFELLERHAARPQPPSRGDWLFVTGVIAVIVGVAMIPLFVMYWLGHAIGAYLSALAR